MLVPARLLLALAFLTAAPAFAHSVDVTTCGQTVDGRGVLVADLDCTGVTFPAVNVHGRLDLNGHTLTGGGTNVAVHCLDHKCKITGPGTITGTGGVGVLGRRRLTMKDVTITGMSGGVAIESADGKGGATLERCTLSDNDIGVTSDTRLKLVDTTISGTHLWGAAAAPPFFNLGTPCEARGLSLKRSSVTGAADDPSCGVTNICGDLITCVKPPKLGGSTCGTSCRGGTGVPCSSWGICAGD